MNYTNLINKRNSSLLKTLLYGIGIPGSFIGGLGGIALSTGGVTIWGSSGGSNKSEEKIDTVLIGSWIGCISLAVIGSIFCSRRCFKNGKNFITYQKELKTLMNDVFAKDGNVNTKK